MKISFEFKDLRDMMTDLPRFVSLVGSDKPFAERLREALPPDPHTLTIKVTPKDGVPFTEDEKQKITEILTQYVRNPQEFIEKAKAEKAAGEEKDALAEAMNPPEEPVQEAAQPAAKEEPKESPTEEEKPAEEPTAKQSSVSEVDARARLNQLVKTTRYNASVKLIFHHFGAKVFGDLKPEHYAEAVKMADEIETLPEDELLKKFEEAGIKAKKKEV